MQSRIATHVVLQTLFMAVWRRKPKNEVLIRSDQGAQFTSIDRAFLKHHNLVHSVSRFGNCRNDAVANSGFNRLKRKRICRKVYRSRHEFRHDVFNYIETFYDPKREHFRYEILPPSSSSACRKSNARCLRNSELFKFCGCLDHGLQVKSGRLSSSWGSTYQKLVPAITPRRSIHVANGFLFP